MVLDHFRKAAADRVERGPVPKADPSRATDRILLPLLVINAEAREQLLRELKGLPALKLLNTAPIFDALFAMYEGGETISFNTLHARVPEAMQDVLAALVLDAMTGGDTTVEDGLACVAALRRDDREAVVRDLKTRIKAAEREGRMSEALALMQQLSQVA
jgi:hypothetical protein